MGEPPRTCSVGGEKDIHTQTQGKLGVLCRAGGKWPEPGLRGFGRFWPQDFVLPAVKPGLYRLPTPAWLCIGPWPRGPVGTSRRRCL